MDAYSPQKKGANFCSATVPRMMATPAHFSVSPLRESWAVITPLSSPVIVIKNLVAFSTSISHLGGLQIFRQHIYVLVTGVQELRAFFFGNILALNQPPRVGADMIVYLLGQVGSEKIPSVLGSRDGH